VPVTARAQLDGISRFLRTLAEPTGSIKIVGVRLPDTESAPTSNDLDGIPEVTRTFQGEELMATSVTVEAPSLLKGVQMSASVLRGSAFRPNILFGLAHRYDTATLQGVVDVADQFEMGAALLYEHPEAALSQERRVNVWVTDQSPDWDGLRLPNLDLPLLLTLQILKN